jgi:hypothetical protein
LLGGGPAAFVAHDDGELFVGGAVDISLAALMKSGETGFHCAEGTRRRECHASHRRFYGEFEVLDSLRHGESSLFTYGFGYSASFEYFPAGVRSSHTTGSSSEVCIATDSVIACRRRRI